MTPDEAWAAKFDASLQHLPTQSELRELFMPAVLRTARRGEVQFFNQTYSAPELMRRDVEGHEVSVRYDIHDPSWVRIYTLDGQFVCDARFAANRIDAMPKAVVQIAHGMAEHAARYARFADALTAAGLEGSFDSEFTRGTTTLDRVLGARLDL